MLLARVGDRIGKGIRVAPRDALSTYPVGALSDRVNRKTLLILGWGLNALIYLGLAFSQAPWQFGYRR